MRGSPCRTRRLLLDGARRAALYEVLGEGDIERDDGNGDEDRACREHGELAVVEGVEPDGDRPRRFIDEEHAREHEVGPGPDERRERRIDDHGLGERQSDRHKDAQTVCAVQRSGVVDGGGNGVEEALLHKEAHCGAAAIQQNEAPEIVDEVQLRHNDEERGHVHEVGKDAENERRLHHGLAASEAIARNGVRHRNDQKGGDRTADRRDDEGIPEPAGVVVLVDLGEQPAEGIETVRFGKEAFQRQEIPFRIESGQNEPDARKGKEETDEKHQKIDERRLGNPCGAEMHGCVHR